MGFLQILDHWAFVSIDAQGTGRFPTEVMRLLENLTNHLGGEWEWRDSITAFSYTGTFFLLVQNMLLRHEFSPTISTKTRRKARQDLVIQQRVAAEKIQNLRRVSLEENEIKSRMQKLTKMSQQSLN